MFPQGDFVTRDLKKRFLITVTSTPCNADVYLNSNFIGKTPIKNFPVDITYQVAASGMFFSSTPWGINCAGCLKYFLEVGKKGYYSSIAKLEFIDLGGTKLGLKTKQYDFNLEEKESLKTGISHEEYSKNEVPINTFDLIFEKNDTVYENSNWVDLRGNTFLERAIAKAALITLKDNFKYFTILSNKFFVIQEEGLFKEVNEFTPEVKLVILKIQEQKQLISLPSLVCYEAAQVLKDVNKRARY